VGTEHVLAALVRDPDGGATRVLRELAVPPAEVERALAYCLGGGLPSPKIDAEALATLGIDFEAVREHVERTFGPGALDRTRAGCLGIAPRLKQALAHALDYADGRPLADEHVLLGMLCVADSVAAHVLRGVGVSLKAAQRAVGEMQRG
jgi:ATP-dependent Clp protease ATP-binding subunit ClpA